MADKPSKVVQIAGQRREEDVSLVGVDLIYLNLNAVLTSVETALRYANKELPARSRKAASS